MENRIIKYNKNLRTLLVKEIIYELTDNDHYLTAGEIIDVLKDRYGITTTRQRIYEDIDLLNDAGFDIECIRSSQNKYHVVSRDFDIAELRILIDAVESSKSLTCSRSMELAKKIANLAGPCAAESLISSIDFHSRKKSENNQVYYIINTINDAINMRRIISFKYYEYAVNRAKIIKREEDEHKVSPYRLAWSGDFYYLIAFSEKYKKVVTFRVDRISSVPVIMNRNCVPEPDGFNIDDYINDSFRMNSGDKILVELIIKEEVMGNLVDRFGPDLHITSQKDDNCICTVNTSLGSGFYGWVFGFEGKVKISGPKEIKDTYLRMVSKEMARL